MVGSQLRSARIIAKYTNQNVSKITIIHAQVEKLINVDTILPLQAILLNKMHRNPSLQLAVAER